MISIHKRVFCVFLGFLLAVSGCGEHFTRHCKDMSDEISTPPNMRVNYHPILTPITDFTGECYCHVEDAVIVTAIASIIAIHLSRPLVEGAAIAKCCR